MMCSRDLAATRAKEKEADEDYRERRRQQWAKYNATDAGKARLRRHRKPHQAARESQDEAQASPCDPQTTPQATQPNVSSSYAGPAPVKRRRRRRQLMDGFES
jgi:hypothetical protein